MPRRAIGFIGEHSAEYPLIADLRRIIGSANALPLYFWTDREGSSLARQSADQVRVVAFYPRRPKVRMLEDDRITVKFNEVLFDHAARLSRNGIPLLAGVPRASALRELLGNVPCSWFDISGDDHDRHAREGTVELARNDGRLLTRSITGVNGPLSDVHLRTLLMEGHVRTFNEVADAIADARPRERYPGPFGFGGRYKPVYLLIWS